MLSSGSSRSHSLLLRSPCYLQPQLPLSLESVEFPEPARASIMSTPNALEAPASLTPSLTQQASQTEPDAAEAQ